MKPQLKVFLIALVATVVGTGAQAVEPNSGPSEQLRAFLDQVAERRPLLATDLAELAAVSPSPDVAAVARTLTKIPLPLEALRRSPQQDFLLVIDRRGGVHAIDLVARPGVAIRLKAPMSEATFKANQARVKTVESFIIRGASPPFSLAHAQIMGLDFEPPKTVFDTPAMSWNIARGATGNAAADCLFMSFHRNFTTKERVNLGSVAESVCREGRGFVLRPVVTEQMSKPVQSPDGSRIAFVTWKGLFVRDLAGAPVVTPPGERDFGEVVWLDAQWVMSYSDDAPAQVHDLVGGGLSELAYRETPSSPSKSGLRINRAVADPTSRTVRLSGPNGSSFIWRPGDGGAVGPAPE